MMKVLGGGGKNAYIAESCHSVVKQVSQDMLFTPRMLQIIIKCYYNFCD
jgi:hypothetical protein